MKKVLAYLKETWTIWVLVLIITYILYWTFLSPFIEYSSLQEPRLYMRMALLLIAIQTFALLRMYNAVVSNTRFILKLRTALKVMSLDINKLIKANAKLKSGVGRLTDQISKLNKYKEKE